MANQKIKLTVDIAADASQASKVINELKDQLSSIKISGDSDGKLLNKYKSQLSEYEKILNKISNFKLNTGNADQYLVLVNKLKATYGDLQATLENINAIQNQNAANEKKNLEKQIADLEKKIQDAKNRALQAHPEFDFSKSAKEQGLTGQVANSFRGTQAYITKITKLIEALQGKLKETGADSKNFDIINQAVQALVPSLNSANDSADELNNTLAENARQAAKDTIDTLIKRFLSFRMVVDIGRKAIRQFSTTMMELDKSLTSIAAVTGRTRDSMWGMVSTYNQMAQQLGTTTSQITQAAKLYYQQGRNDAEVMDLVRQTAILATTAEIDYADATNSLTAAVNGFNMAAEESYRITDTWSALAASAAVSVEELSEATKKVASLAKSSGMEIETTSAFLAKMINWL